MPRKTAEAAGSQIAAKKEVEHFACANVHFSTETTSIELFYIMITQTIMFYHFIIILPPLICVIQMVSRDVCIINL